jgi:hypothetical protein
MIEPQLNMEQTLPMIQTEEGIFSPTSVYVFTGLLAIPFSMCFYGVVWAIRGFVECLVHSLGY